VITKWLGNDHWIIKLNFLELLVAHANDSNLQKEFLEANLYLKTNQYYDFPK
jgi:hypothetical protein